MSFGALRRHSAATFSRRQVRTHRLRGHELHLLVLANAREKLLLECLADLLALLLVLLILALVHEEQRVHERTENAAEDGPDPEDPVVLPVSGHNRRAKAAGGVDAAVGKGIAKMCARKIERPMASGAKLPERPLGLSALGSMAVPNTTKTSKAVKTNSMKKPWAGSTFHKTRVSSVASVPLASITVVVVT
eukprot:Opistho-2@8061